MDEGMDTYGPRSHLGGGRAVGKAWGENQRSRGSHTQQMQHTLSEGLRFP